MKFVLWNDQAGPSVVEAVCIEHAIEFWLATHGLFGYDVVYYDEVDGIDLLSSVLSIIPNKDVQNLIGHHYGTRVNLFTHVVPDEKSA